jgi:hypothetical protein
LQSEIQALEGFWISAQSQQQGCGWSKPQGIGAGQGEQFLARVDLVRRKLTILKTNEIDESPPLIEVCRRQCPR